MGAGAGLKGGRGAQVPFGQVHHVDVVAHAGAVGRGVVVAKNGQRLQANGNRCGVGEDRLSGRQCDRSLTPCKCLAKSMLS
jgi:hypothetical protein